jgi:hypothetical protein
MAKKPAKKTSRRNKSGAGLSISGGRDVSVGGDVVMGNKTTTTTVNLSALDKALQPVQQKIDALPVAPDAKAELKENVQKIRDEVKKGDQADPARVERWLKFIGAISGDIVQVVGAALVNPAAGAGTAIRLIAQKAQQGLV